MLCFHGIELRSWDYFAPVVSDATTSLSGCATFCGVKSVAGSACANTIAEIYPAILKEIEDAKDNLKKMGKGWAIDWHGKAIVKEAERQEAKSVG